ncbi:hypothetical protein CEXT_463211 [Caerostris extrusa]|uniref:Uncharacterized protein n=1 Tax=Caerostris extrusa TaxID=172846 RepID=A0AAV4SB33_CAEEX|nr:hypothetical protein CEXT_463211 [Caerostris extrusa]
MIGSPLPLPQIQIEKKAGAAKAENTTGVLDRRVYREGGGGGMYPVNHTYLMEPSNRLGNGDDVLAPIPRDPQTINTVGVTEPGGQMFS